MDVFEARRLTNRIYTRLSARRPEIDEGERYRDGKQPLTFATEEWKKANAARYADFSDNWCGTVISAEAERLKPTGFAGFDAAGQAWDALQRNEFDAQFAQGVHTALTSRRAYVILWGDPDNDEPVVTVEHPSNVEIEYNAENPRRRDAALKTWVDEDTEYATLYTPRQLFKWKRKRFTQKSERESLAEQRKETVAPDGGWEPRSGDWLDTSWIVPNPLGLVPVVEIQNRPTLKGDPLSEIAGVIPMQNAINLLWAYLFLAADYASMEARVILSSDPPKIPILDKDGQPIGSRPVEMKDLREKRLLTLSGDNAKIDSWSAARLDIFTDTIEIAVGHIAAQTRTPPHYLVSNKGLSNLSGDALKSAETGLTKKASEFITFANPALREVARLVLLVQNQQAAADEARTARVTWESPEIRSEAQMVDALQKKAAIGWPFEALLEEYGYSPAQIERILSMRQRDNEALMGVGVQAAVQEGMMLDDVPDADRE